MPRYVFAVRHFAYADLQDDAAGMELPDDAAAREFAAKVMRGLVRHPGRRLGGLALYYRWSKDFLEAGKKRLAGDTARAATSDEVNDLRREAMALKEVVADLTLENRVLKKSVTGDGEDGE